MDGAAALFGVQGCVKRRYMCVSMVACGNLGVVAICGLLGL